MAIDVYSFGCVLYEVSFRSREISVLAPPSEVLAIESGCAIFTAAFVRGDATRAL